ncbi:odorant receptor 131-2-like [Synchiropus picturatus]
MVSNSSVAVELQSELERIMVSVFTGVPCVVLLTINAIILFTLRSKQVFRETSRYVLLTNLLVADTLFMMMSQILYMLANGRLILTYPVCGTLILYTMLTETIFPLTLAVMSIERYVAVCFPLRHSSIVTMRSTAAAIALVWAFSIVNVLIRVVLIYQFAYEELDTAAEYDRIFVRMMIVMYVLVVLLPRCLSSLIYGLRDQTIRPVLLSNLCFGLKLAAKKQIS